MAASLENIYRKVESLRRAASDRDQRQRNVHDVRCGDIDTVVPGSMPDAWPKPIVANLIDTTARDTAEVMGTLPSINCATGVLTTDKAKKFAGKKTKIANHYIQASGLPAGRQVSAADYWLTYGMAIYCVEPDFVEKRPHIRVENPMGVYPEWDAFGRLKSYSKVWSEEAVHLVAKFPQLEKFLRGNKADPKQGGWEHRMVEIVKYVDADQMVMYLPNHSNMPVAPPMENPMGKVMVSIGKRPGYDREIRGAFDDAIWVHLAKARFALLGLEASEKTVRAPLVVPRDLQHMSFGDDSILRTDNPNGVQRAGIDIPQAAFQQGALLEQELRVGTRTPEARSGNVDASIITGRGVQALMGGFNTVVTTGQTVLAEALKGAINLCFEMDEKLWPNERKTVRGTVQGTPFEETYIPNRDIGGDYTVDVTYGFAAGQDPARAIVGLLQLRGDQLISRDFFQRQLPMGIDVTQMQVQIDNEQLTDALKQGVMGYAQAIPQMALQGMDPVDGLMKLARMMELREKGVPIQDAILKAFTPPKAPRAPQNPLEAAMGQSPQGAPGGAPVAPGGAPQAQGMDLMTLLSGLKSNGEATSSVRSQRQSAI